MLPILFENDHIIAVDKPEGLAAIPERKKAALSVLSQLSVGTQRKIYVVHRLDKEASGVIVFAKNAQAHQYLCRQFASHAVNKTYLALTHGRLQQESGTIDKPLRQFGSGRVAVDTGLGKPCLTEFSVVERFAPPMDYTLVRAQPVTGRRHQLRVHFYSIGHPIVGDPLYGQQEKSDERRATNKRLMLHAEKITFQLPSGRELTIEAPPPESFQQVIESLRNRNRHHGGNG